jgi:hypothetical protein
MCPHPSRGAAGPRLLLLVLSLLSSLLGSSSADSWAQVSHYADAACTLRSQDYYYKMDTCFRVLPPGGAVGAFKLVSSGTGTSGVAEKLTYGTSDCSGVAANRVDVTVGACIAASKEKIVNVSIPRGALDDTAAIATAEYVNGAVLGAGCEGEPRYKFWALDPDTGKGYCYKKGNAVGLYKLHSVDP